MRKHQIISLLGAWLVVLALGQSLRKPAQAQATNPWAAMQTIDEAVGRPVFADRQFDIRSYGARPDGQTLCTQAIAQAIAACTLAGGGRVVVPAGRFLTGPIHLDNNVNLHLDSGAVLLFSTQPEHYLPLVHTSWEGTELMNYSPLIYAYQKKNIGITGKGTLDGQASSANWWVWKGSKEYGWKKGMPSQLDPGNRDRLVQMAEDGVPVPERIFGQGHYLRPSFVQPFECEQVLIEGVTLVNAPFWVIHPVKCQRVRVNGVHVQSHGPNNDGCDPEYSNHVLIEHARFDTGDDCIAIKAGRDADGRRVALPSHNIVVRNCKMVDGHGGVVIGSEISAGVHHVYVDSCQMDSPNLDRAIRIKTNSNRGGVIEHVYVRRLEVGQVKEAVLKLNMFYGAYNDKPGPYLPTIRHIVLQDVRVRNGGYYGILAKGYAQSPISDVRLERVAIERVDEAFSIEHLRGLRLVDTYINGSLMQSPPDTLTH